MKKEIIQSLTRTFEDYANVTENNVEFWFARDLQHLLEYTKKNTKSQLHFTR